MKHANKNFGIIAAAVIAILTAGIFTACGGGGGGGGPSTGGVARFNMTGAKAVLATGGQTSGRAVARPVTENGGLFKLVGDNDSVVSVFNRNQDMAPISFMRGSPAETGRKDLYIQFTDSWTFKTDNGESVRIDKLIHVREDGTVVNLLDDLHLYFYVTSVKFDGKGNLYFQNDKTLYKYDPETGKKETLFSGGNYDFSFYPSYNGSFVIVGEGLSDSYRECKLIPCDNPSQAYDLSIGISDVSSFATSRTKMEVYLLKKEEPFLGKFRLCKLSSNGGISEDDWQLTILINDVVPNVDLFVAPDNSVWGHDYRTGFYRLIDKNEQFDDLFVSFDQYTMFLTSAPYFYYLSDGPEKIGANEYLYRNISRFCYGDNNPVVEKLFDKVDFGKRNKNNIVSSGFSIAGGFLYLNGEEAKLDQTGSIAGYWFIGKINLTTFEYTEITLEEKSTAIVGW